MRQKLLPLQINGLIHISVYMAGEKLQHLLTGDKAIVVHWFVFLCTSQRRKTQRASNSVRRTQHVIRTLHTR